jgi:hypothetical protein
MELKMSGLITCPHCANDFQIDQVISAQLTAELRQEFEKEFSQKAQNLAKEREKLAELQKQLEAARQDIDTQVQQAITKERAVLMNKARVEAQQAVAIDLQDREEQLKITQEQFKALKKQELELHKKNRELVEQAENQELERIRWQEQERVTLREAALKQAEEQSQLKRAEDKLLIESMRKQIEDLQRKAEQGSQQLQGEAQEIVLQDLLLTLFPGDIIEEVGKGVRGGDVIQQVIDSNGRECGAILWESKRTKNWSEQWLSKAIDDQQNAKATCACIVSSVIPATLQHFGELNGVWVASWSCARSIATVLRKVLVETARARTAFAGQASKKEQVYTYLAGPEFRNRIRGLMEPFIDMQADLEAEKRAYNKHWNKRQKQLDRALSSTTGLYGDLQGIIGSELKEIEGMDLLAIEKVEAEEFSFEN